MVLVTPTRAPPTGAAMLPQKFAAAATARVPVGQGTAAGPLLPAQAVISRDPTKPATAAQDSRAPGYRPITCLRDIPNRTEQPPQPNAGDNAHKYCTY